MAFIHTMPRPFRGPRIPGDRRHLAMAVTLALVPVGLAVIAASLTVGAAPVSLTDAVAVFRGLFGTDPAAGPSPRTSVILLDIRLPRTFLGFLVGSGLAVAGAAMQALFRNPLADPAIIGISSGSALSAVAFIVAGPALLPALSWLPPAFMLPVAAFFGGLAVTILLYGLSTRNGMTSVATMLLAGIAITALANAAIGVFIFVSDDQQLRELTFWMLGSLTGATWNKLAAAAPLVLPALIAAPFLGRGLNAFQLGEAPAMHVGVDVQRLKRTLFVLVACAVGAAVAVSGIIGFVGIVVPHMLRLAIGPDNRLLLPACALLGGILLLGADMVSRTIVAPAELPIGIVTALIGAPFFLWLLLRRRAAIDL